MMKSLIQYKFKTRKMNQSIREKSNKYRSDLRKQFLEEYFKQRREELLNSQEEKGERTVNQEVQQPLLQTNILRLYEMFYINDGVKRLSLLNKQNCINLFNVLAKNLNEIQCILLLNTLIDRQYRIVFLCRQQQAYNRQFVHHLYQTFYKTVQQYKHQQNQSNRSFLKSKLGGYLNCIKSLIWMKDEYLGENGFMFDEVCNPELLKDLWKALDVLIDSPIYLTVLMLAEIELDFTASVEFQEYLEGNRPIFVQLIENIVHQKKILAPLSLHLVNSIMKNTTNRLQLVYSFLPLYLSKLKMIYSSTQENANNKRIFKFANFVDMLDNVSAIFQLFQQEILAVHLGELIRQHNLWTLFILILRIQTQSIRKRLYSLIKSSIKNMRVNRARLEMFIDQYFFQFVNEGLEQQFPKIIIDNLQILQCLLTYQKNNERETVNFVNELAGFDIEATLENLAYSQNKEIAQKANEMMELFKQIMNGKEYMVIE